MNDDEPLSQSRARYEVITTLGQGGMARVLLTMSRGPAGVNKLLVVKELKAELKGDPEFLTMFMDEARIAARLNHPNVIQTYEVSSDGEHPLIVMEYLEGQAMSALLGRVGRKNIPLELHLYMLAQTCAGLHYAHELKSFEGDPLGVVHRDVSPHNVFVTYDGLVKLVDFGIAKAADSGGLTRTGVFKGKAGYAAPEQVGAGPAIDRRADVFALGVMLWEALAQRRMTMGEPEAVVMTRRLSGKDQRIKDAAPDAPDELCRICDKAMAFDPEDRFATAAELRAAIEGHLETSKRVGADEIGELVRRTFAAEREKVRGLVEAQIRAVNAGEAPPPLNPSVMSGLRPMSQRTMPTVSAVLDAGDSTAKIAASSASSPALRPEPEGRRGRLLIGGGVAVALAVVGLQLSRGASPGTAPEPPSSATPAQIAAPATAATVDVWISVDPGEARVFLDDLALASNPFHSTMPKSALARRLRVSAPGYATDERLVALDRDVHLELSLKPAATAAPTSSAAAAPGRPGPAAAPGRAGAAPPSTAAPGEALAPTPKKPTRSIDDTF
jgi:serine/threonine-protein kinase